MARDQSGSAHPSPEDRKASDRAGRKRLGANGYPRSAFDPEARDAADRSTATRNPDPAPIEPSADEA